MRNYVLISYHANTEAYEMLGPDDDYQVMYSGYQPHPEFSGEWLEFADHLKPQQVLDELQDRAAASYPGIPAYYVEEDWREDYCEQ